MKIRRKISMGLRLLSLSLAILSLPSCSPQQYESQMYSMDTLMTLTAYGSDCRNTVNKCEIEIARINSLLSISEADSDIYRINENAGRFTDVSEETIHLIKESQIISERTDGAFDITSGVLSQLWGFRDKNYRVPSKSEITAALNNVDYTKIEIEGNSVKIPIGTSIDLGSIGKGYASQRTHDIFGSSRVSSAIVSLGGNVQLYGSKPDGSDWRVAIRHPENTSDYIAVLSASDKAVVTSGGYQRYFEENSKIYHHIFDANTGYPADNGIISATVICNNGMTADALSTALYVIGADKAINYYNEYGGFDMILVCDSGRVVITSGIEDVFELSDDSGKYTVEVI